MIKKQNLFMLLACILLLLIGCTRKKSKNDLSFEDLCKKDGKKWMKMMPMINGILTGEPKCFGCMADETHICNEKEYKSYLEGRNAK